MVLDIEPVDATFGAVVRGIKLKALDDATWSALYDAWLQYALLIFPGQHLIREEQIALSRRFGPLEFEMARISNVKPDGTMYTRAQDPEMFAMIDAAHYWHSDSTYKTIQAKCSVFSAAIVPEGGTQTGWADMRAAYDVLDPAMRARIEQMFAYHSYYRKQAKRGVITSAKTSAETLGLDGVSAASSVNEDSPPLRPMVKVHPETGRKSLLIGDHICGISGMTEDESELLVKELTDFVCQPPRTYHHDWTPGDTVVWDNRCLLHRSRPWNISLRRLMWHTRIAGDAVTEAALT